MYCNEGNTLIIFLIDTHYTLWNHSILANVDLSGRNLLRLNKTDQICPTATPRRRRSSPGSLPRGRVGRESRPPARTRWQLSSPGLVECSLCPSPRGEREGSEVVEKGCQLREADSLWQTSHSSLALVLFATNRTLKRDLITSAYPSSKILRR